MAKTTHVLVLFTALALVAGCSKLSGSKAKPSPSASGAASAASAPTAASDTSTSGAEATSAISSSIDQGVTHECERECQADCVAEALGDRAWYERKRARVAKSLFKFELTRVYLYGSCARGDKPADRSDGDGVQVVVDGKLTYNGKDLLGSAALGGSTYLRFGDRYAAVPMLEKSYSAWVGTRTVSRLARPARGGDPWLPGEARAFRDWESQTFNSVFCEAEPDAAEAYIEVTTSGIRGGRDVQPVAFVPVEWREVVGMVVGKPASLEKTNANNELTLEPVQALYSRLGQLLVTRENGKTERVSRYNVDQPAPFPAGDAPAMPVEAKSPGFTVRVKAIATQKDFGVYEPKGEDQFLTLVDVEIQSTQSADGDKEPKPAKVKDFSFKLETSPGHWATPLKQPMGVLDGDHEIAVGGTESGKLAFPRQRFERPTRFEVKTADKQTFDLDVLSYAIGPERAPK